MGKPNKKHTFVAENSASHKKGGENTSFLSKRM